MSILTEQGKRMTGFARAPKPPSRCEICKGSGVIQGVCMPLSCVECHGIGWVPMEGQNLVEQLGRALTKAVQRLRLHAAMEDTFGPENDYKDNGRNGQRGNWTGD